MPPVTLTAVSGSAESADTAPVCKMGNDLYCHCRHSSKFIRSDLAAVPAHSAALTAADRVARLQQ